MSLANVYNKRRKSFIRDKKYVKKLQFRKKEFDLKAEQKLSSFRSSFRTLSCQQFSCLSCQQVRKICQKATKATCNSKKRIRSEGCTKNQLVSNWKKKKQFESWQVVWKLSAVIQHAKWKGWWGWNSSHHRRRWTQKRSRGLDVKQRSSSFKSGFF